MKRNAPIACAKGGSPPTRCGGFTLVEVLVCIALVATLAAMLFPVLARAKIPANGAACASNLHTLSLAVDLYAGDHDARYPLGVNPSDAYTKCRGRTPETGPQFAAVVAPYVKEPRAFRCPLDSGVPNVPARDYGESLECDLPGTAPSMYVRYGASYEFRDDLGIEGASHPATLASPYDGTEHGPAEVPILWDAYGLWHGDRDPAMELGGRRRYNAAFADGHLKTISQQTLAASGTWIVRPNAPRS